MSLFLNLIVGIWMAFYAIRIYSSKRLKLVQHPLAPNIKCFLNRDLHFLIFCIATAMVFLGPLSLVKYGFWILFMLLLLFVRFKIKVDVIVICYSLFLIWAAISISYSSVKFQGAMLLIKYSLPLLYLWLGYNAIQDYEDLLFFLKKSLLIMAIYAFFIGGFSAKVLPWLYVLLCFKTGGLVISYASLADFFSALFVIPLALYIIDKKKKWLLVAIWVALSSILAVVRTGIGGIFLATTFFLLGYYRLRALPWIGGLLLLGITAIFFIPAVHEKMFVDDRTTISSMDASSMNFENIQSNGRELIWDTNLELFYKPNPVVGAGLGESMEYTKENFVVKLIHNDYVQILCDMGLIGISLFALFFVITILKIVTYSMLYKHQLIRLSGAMALGSCAGVFFSMTFDNVISYAQQCFVIPFIFIGIFLKIVDLYKRGRLIDIRYSI